MWKEFLYSLINFLILFGALFFLTRKLIAKTFRGRRERIAQDLEDAETARADAERLRQRRCRERLHDGEPRGRRRQVRRNVADRQRELGDGHHPARQDADAPQDGILSVDGATNKSRAAPFGAALMKTVKKAGESS